MRALVASTANYDPGSEQRVTQTAEGALRVHLVNPAGGSSGGLTDEELRAEPIDVLGVVSVSNFPATQPVSLAAIPNSSNIDVALSTRLKPGDSVNVGNFPGTQQVGGTVGVNNLPAWPYPATVTPVAEQSTVGANAIKTATLAAAVNKFTYLSSVQIFATGATAAGAVNATITGLLGGTMTIPFAVPAGVNLAATPVNLKFDPPLRSSAQNIPIFVTLPALGAGNTRATVNAQGFQQ